MIIHSISNRYSFLQKIDLAATVLKTKLICPQARIIRRGFICRGKSMIDFGTRLTTGVGCRLEAFSADGNNDKKLFLGHNVQLNDHVHISAISSVTIGDNTLIASHVYISDNSHGIYQDNGCSPHIPPLKRPYYASSVKIGSNVWLGEGVIIMPGATIGDGAVIRAHSIVKNDIPANCIAVGAPAKIIKIWNNEHKHWEKI